MSRAPQIAGHAVYMVKLYHRFLRDDSGNTAIEYGILALGISAAIIASVNDLGTKLITTFSALGTPTWHVEPPSY
jgi:pilus assembly protein Flp/PilA